MFIFSLDDELVGVALNPATSTVTLMPPPPSPKQLIRGGSSKQRSIKRYSSSGSGSNKSVSAQQMPSVEYVSEKSSEMAFASMSSRKRNGKPPSGK